MKCRRCNSMIDISGQYWSIEKPSNGQKKDIELCEKCGKLLSKIGNRLTAVKEEYREFFKSIGL